MINVEGLSRSKFRLGETYLETQIREQLQKEIPLEQEDGPVLMTTKPVVQVEIKENGPAMGKSLHRGHNFGKYQSSCGKAKRESVKVVNRIANIEMEVLEHTGVHGDMQVCVHQVEGKFPLTWQDVSQQRENVSILT